jgi:hypothetical protein
VVYFGRPWEGKCWWISCTLGILIAILVYFMAIYFGICVFVPFWFVLPKKSGNPDVQFVAVIPTEKPIVCSYSNSAL